jgi:hypothetical protein
MSMAKKMKDDAPAKPKSKAGHNGFDPAVLNSIVDRIEGVFVEGIKQLPDAPPASA